MSKTPGSKRAARSLAVAGTIVLVICLAAGVLWFFADPLHVPDQVLQVLDQRASVVGMFTGMVLGAAALVVAVVALRAQLRAEDVPAEAEQQATPPAVSASGDGAVALGGDNSGIVSTGDGVRNVHMRAEASGQGRIYQAGGDQTINER